MSGGNGGDMQFQLRVEGPFSPALSSSDCSTSLTLQQPHSQVCQAPGKVATEWGGGQRAGAEKTGMVLSCLEIRTEGELWFLL